MPSKEDATASLAEGIHKLHAVMNTVKQYMQKQNAAEKMMNLMGLTNEEYHPEMKGLHVRLR